MKAGIWFLAGMIQTGCALINLPGVNTGNMISISSMIFCGTLAVVSYSLAVAFVIKGE